MKSRYLLILPVSLFIACFNPKKYDEVKPEGLFSVISSDSSVIADGVDAYTIRVVIDDKKAAKSKQVVVFKTTLGVFNGGSDSIVVNANDERECAAELTSVKSGVAVLTAKLQGIEAKVKPSVTFTKVLAEKIAVGVDSIAVKNDNKSEVVITATLGTLSGGKPSAGTLVFMAVTDNLGQAVGAFLNNINSGKTDNNGQVRLRYVPLNTTYTGYLTITASTTASSGQTISAATRIFLTK